MCDSRASTLQMFNCAAGCPATQPQLKECALPRAAIRQDRGSSHDPLHGQGDCCLCQRPWQLTVGSIPHLRSFPWRALPCVAALSLLGRISIMLVSGDCVAWRGVAGCLVESQQSEHPCQSKSAGKVHHKELVQVVHLSCRPKAQGVGEPGR